MTVVTKKGDKGMTDVLGKRLPKDDQLIELIGEIDELSAVIGVAKLERIGLAINHDLYQIMGYLAGYVKNIELEDSIKLMEKDIERMEKPVDKFLKPGVEMNVMINWARTVCRRTERRAVAMKNYELVGKYLNRLSDYLFILSREIK